MEEEPRIVRMENHKCYAHSVLDSKTISIHVDNIDVFEEGYNKYTKTMESITIGGKLTIRVNDYFEVRLTNRRNLYHIKYILRNAKDNYHLKTHLNNLTTKYLLPCFGKTGVFLSHDHYLVNAYLDSDSKHINLMYRYLADEHYKKTEKNILSMDLYRASEDIDNEFVLHQLRIPRQFIKDVELFKQGKYSEFSNVLKSRIQTFHGVSQKSSIYGVLYKTKEHRHLVESSLGVSIEGELESKPNENDYLNF